MLRHLGFTGVFLFTDQPLSKLDKLRSLLLYYPLMSYNPNAPGDRSSLRDIALAYAAAHLIFSPRSHELDTVTAIYAGGRVRRLVTLPEL